MPRRVTGPVEIEDIDYINSITHVIARKSQLNPSVTLTPIQAIEEIIRDYAKIVAAIRG